MTSLVDRHVLGEWLKNLGLMLGATLGLLVLFDMSRNFGDFIQNGAGVTEILYYYLVMIPGGVPVVLPVSVLLSLLYSLGQLHRNNEFVALRAAGLGLFRITRAVWAFGFVLAALTWYFNASLIPWSVEEARRVRDRIEFSAAAKKGAAADSGMETAVTFANPAAGRVWFINRYHGYTQHAYGVTISILDGRKREVRRLLAGEAVYQPGRNTWVLARGRELTFDPERQVLAGVRQFLEHVEPGLDDSPELMLLLRRKAADLSLFELERVLDYLRREHDPRLRAYQVQYERRLASPAGVLIVMALAVPFAIAGVRVNPAVGVSKSIGLFFLHYVLTSLGSLLGERGALDPMVAAWLPDLAMLAVAVWFLRRVR